MSELLSSKTHRDQSVFRDRLEFLEQWRRDYGGDSALREAERLYAELRSGLRPVIGQYTSLRRSPTNWYWRRSGEGRQAVFVEVCPWCLPGPPGSEPFVKERYMSLWSSDREWLHGTSPWSLECAACGRTGRVD